MTTLIKRFQLGLVSLSAVALLAACSDGGTTEEPATTDNAVEETAPAEETTPGDDQTEDAAGNDAAQGGNTGTEDAASQDPDTIDTSNGIHEVDFPIALEQAVQMFQDTFGGGINIDEIEFDEENGAYEYHISGWDDQNDYDLDINAETGEIVEQESERDDDTEDDIIDVNNIIEPQAAMDIATQETGTDIVESWSIEVDDGRTVYEVDTEGADEDDITLNAETGDVVDR